MSHLWLEYLKNINRTRELRYGNLTRGHSPSTAPPSLPYLVLILGRQLAEEKWRGVCVSVAVMKKNGNTIKRNGKFDAVHKLLEVDCCFNSFPSYLAPTELGILFVRVNEGATIQKL